MLRFAEVLGDASFRRFVPKPTHLTIALRAGLVAIDEA